MKTVNLIKKWATVVLAVLMMVSLFTVSAFAEGEEVAPEETGLSTQALVWIIVGGALLVIAIVLCLAFRKKFAKGLRVYKSEVKKVVWLPWDQTKKSTLVVLVVLIVFAVGIGLLDFALGKGFVAGLKLFTK